MKKLRTLILIILIVGGWISSSAKESVRVVDFSWFESIRKAQNDTTYVINFWATWCIPCVEELPEFEQINSSCKNQKVKVILVSLDYVKVLEKSVLPLVKKKNIKSEVLLLNESNPNSYIDKVDPSWSGSLPATLIFNNKHSFYRFYEKPLNFAELNTEIIKSFTL